MRRAQHPHRAHPGRRLGGDACRPDGAARRPGGTACDVIRPSADPVPLTDVNRPLSATYTYKGERHTLDDFLTRTKTNGFLVLRGQKIVHERYTDANRATRFQSWSMAKSFTSAAIGVALKEGHIRSLDDPVTRYLPELRGSGYDGVSIRNLLRMSSGIDWDEVKDAPKMQAVAANAVGGVDVDHLDRPARPGGGAGRLPRRRRRRRLDPLV